jgi:hypothetical protein
LTCGCTRMCTVATESSFGECGRRQRSHLVMTAADRFNPCAGTKGTAVAEDDTTILEVSITAAVRCREFEAAVLEKCVVLNFCTRQIALTMYHDSVLMTSNTMIMSDWACNYRNRLPRIITARCSALMLTRYLRQNGMEALPHPQGSFMQIEVDRFEYADIRFERPQVEREQNRANIKARRENRIKREQDREKMTAVAVARVAHGMLRHRSSAPI